MRKIILSITALGLMVSVMVACTNSETKETTAKTTETPQVDSVPVAKPVVTDTPTVPVFASEEVNKSLNELVKLKDDYILAKKNKNQTAVKSISDKYFVWAKSSEKLNGMLKSDEKEKYNNYIDKLNREWGVASYK